MNSANFLCNELRETLINLNGASLLLEWLSDNLDNVEQYGVKIPPYMINHLITIQALLNEIKTEDIKKAFSNNGINTMFPGLENEILNNIYHNNDNLINAVEDELLCMHENINCNGNF